MDTLELPSADLLDLVILPCDTVWVNTGDSCDYPAEFIATCPACNHDDLCCKRCHAVDLIFNHGFGLVKCSQCREPILPVFERIDLR